jgi:hypothetical protein
MKCTTTKHIWDKPRTIYEEISSEEKSSDCSCCESMTEEAQVVRRIKGRSGKFKEREYSDDNEEYLSITMETKHIYE